MAMTDETAIGLHSFLLAASLIVQCMRIWVRTKIEKSRLQSSDYLVLLGWIFSFVWALCCILDLGLGIRDWATVLASVPLLKMELAQQYLFDIGLYLPKISVLLFYWKTIPDCYPKLRIGLFCISGYVVICLLASVLVDTLICLPYDRNWDPNYEANSSWESWITFEANYSFNLSTDLAIFIYPFFLLSHLRLRMSEKLGLIGVFSLGLLTMSIGAVRFGTSISNEGYDVVQNLVMNTAEMCCACIVVTLPLLRVLIWGKEGAGSTRASDTNNKSLSTGDPKVMSYDEFDDVHGSISVSGRTLGSV